MRAKRKWGTYYWNWKPEDRGSWLHSGRKLSQIMSCFTWEAKLVKDKFGYLLKEISKQSVKGPVWFRIAAIISWEFWSYWDATDMNLGVPEDRLCDKQNNDSPKIPCPHGQNLRICFLTWQKGTMANLTKLHILSLRDYPGLPKFA